MDQLVGTAIEDFVKRLAADTDRMLERIGMAARTSPWAAFQQPGDIVLTRGRRPLSHLNAVLQSVLEGGVARATHAMMVAAPGFYADASIRYGVTILPAQLFCIDGTVERQRLAAGAAVLPRPMWRRRLVAAYRHPDIADAAERQSAFLRTIAEQLGQPYNKHFIFKWARPADSDASAFCSELVARTFARLGLEIVPERRFASVLPHTLLRHLKARGWVDVSDAYRQGLPRAVVA